MQPFYAPLIRQILTEFEAQNFAAAQRTALSILKANPKESIALQILGLSFAMQGKALESIDPLQRASKIEPKNSEILNNLAKAQFSADLFEDAAKTYKKLQELNPNNVYILTDHASCLLKLKQYDKALLLFEKALTIDPNHFLAWSNLANLYSALNNHNKALEYHEKALSLNQGIAIGWTHYGNTLFSLGCLQESKLAHERALAIHPNNVEAMLDYSKTLLALKFHAEAYKIYQQAFLLKPEQPYLIGEIVAGKLDACTWSDEAPSADQLHSLVHQNKPSSSPFRLLQSGASIELQKQCAMEYVRNIHPPQDGFRNRVEEAGNRKIRIGYFSSDFKIHPVGILMQNIVKLHDREKFELFGFFLNQSSNDEVEQALTKAFDHTFNLFSMDDAEAIDLVRKQNIDIAIDLNGHTSGARTNIFASRVAPVQVNYLGYPGTLGADYFNYLIADEVVVPPEHQNFYVEQISNLPNSFFPVDTTISIEELGDIPSRMSEGLPESGFIFGSFNNAYKITPEIFSVWMDLLEQVPDSVLWLSRPSDIAIDNLKAFAVAAGVDPNRIIFARFAPERKMHLSRLRLISLFLDTPKYNAHATAADALWVGVPVLTLMGQTFAGRVAASQNHALGMDCMITNSLDEYFNLALRIAKDPDLLNELKSKIKSNRKTSPLFDSKQYVRDLEALYTDFIKPNKG
jgi:predicted O-linked N-acetylglucosamine transferase (SPINDLY family)